MGTILAEGSIARFINDTHDLTGRRVYRTGEKFTVGDYVSAEDAEEPKGIAFYYGHTEGGYNNVVVPATSVELHLDVTAAEQRKLPTELEILNSLVSGSVGYFDTFEVDEAGVGIAERDMLSIIGTTEDGLRFHALVEVNSVDYTD